MITIYKQNCIPKDMELISLNDAFFNSYTSQWLDDRARDIIKNIDDSEWQGGNSVKSRFDGTILNIDRLSTGCKTALNIFYYTHTVFDIRECGDNALDIIYGFEHGNIYCSYPLISFEMKKVKVVDMNGERELSSYEDLKEWWTNEN